MSKHSMERATRGALCVLILLCSMVGIARADTSGIPDFLLRFAEKYPEATDYVMAYPEKKDKSYEIDLTEELERGYPILVQWDERWGYTEYGSSLLGVSGCGPTALSIVVCGLTRTDTWNPVAVARYAEANGEYIRGVGTSWDLMTRGASRLGLTAEQAPVSADFILDNLSEYTPMIASVMPGDFTVSGHFIALVGLDEEGNVLVRDPNSLIRSGQTWEVGRLVRQIKGLWIYRRSHEADALRDPADE